MNKVNKKNFKDYIVMFWEFFKIGLLTIGGGLAMVPIIEDIAVNKKKWISQEEMIDCIALSQAVPGVVAVNVATFIGKRKYGILGSIIATLGVTLPSFLVILVLMSALDFVADSSFLQGVFIGIKASIVGMVVVLTYRLGKQLIDEKASFLIAVLAFALVTFFNFNGIVVIIIAGLIGLVRWAVIKK